MCSSTVFYLPLLCTKFLIHPMINITNVTVILPVFLCRTHTITHNIVFPSHLLTFFAIWLPLPLSVGILHHLQLPLLTIWPLTASQRPQVVTRAGLLPHELSHLSLSRVPGHQAGQETFCTGGDALALAAAAHVLCTGTRGPGGLSPG